MCCRMPPPKKNKKHLKAASKKGGDAYKKGTLHSHFWAISESVLGVVAAREKRKREEEGLQTLTQMRRNAQGACLPFKIGLNSIDQ